MESVEIASKANQALTLPTLLVANYAQRTDPNAQIRIFFQEVDTLNAGENASVELRLANGESMYGSQQVIDKFSEMYALLKGQKGKDVCNAFGADNASADSIIDRRVAWAARFILF